VCGPTPMLGGSLVILLLPLAAERIALGAVVAAIALTCAAIVAITITGEQWRAVRVRRRPRLAGRAS
jgi:hypothetical protein